MARRTRFNIRTITGAVGLAITSTALWWLSPTAPPLSAAEVDSYMARIQAQQQVPGGQHDLKVLAQFLTNDDGAPFYTVNLYGYADTANYLDPTEPTISGRQAYDRFSAVMVKLLARQGSQPIFGSRWMQSSGGRWDRLVIVKYRSRRDIAEVFASEAFADASKHKWAALAAHERLLVQARIIPDLHLLALVGLGLSVVLLLFGWVRPPRARDAE